MFETHIQQGLEAMIKNLSTHPKKGHSTDKAAAAIVETGHRCQAEEPNGATFINTSFNGSKDKSIRAKFPYSG